MTETARRVSWLGAGAVLLGTLSVPLDSAVNVDFPFITRHFQIAIPDIRWIVISYTLTSASLLLVFGRISDLVGHRRVFLLGTASSALSLLLCAAAPDYPLLLAARVAQGVGAGLVLACGPALITAVFPETDRPRALGLYTLGFGLGGALGPAAGALLIARFGWSAVFWARAPLAAAGALAGLLLPIAPAVHRPRFDAAGAALLVAAILALLAALNLLGQPFLAGAAGLVALGLGTGFVAVERRVAMPLIDLAPFRLPGFAWINLASVTLNMAGFAVLLLVPFALARMAGLSIAAGGLVLAALPSGVMLAGPLAGRLAGLVPPRVLMTAGEAACALGLLGIALSPARIGVLVAAMVVAGLGLGAFQVGYFELLTATIPRRDRGVAGSLGMLTRTLGLVAGASLLMALFQSLLASGLAAGLDGTAAFGVGLRDTFLAAAALAAAQAVLGLRVR